MTRTQRIASFGFCQPIGCSSSPPIEISVLYHRFEQNVRCIHYELCVNTLALRVPHCRRCEVCKRTMQPCVPQATWQLHFRLIRCATLVRNRHSGRPSVTPRALRPADDHLNMAQCRISWMGAGVGRARSADQRLGRGLAAQTCGDIGLARARARGLRLNSSKSPHDVEEHPARPRRGVDHLVVQ